MPFREILQATALTAARHPPKARALIFWLLTNRTERARTRFARLAPPEAKRLLRRHDAVRWMARHGGRAETAEAGGPAAEVKFLILMDSVGAEPGAVEAALRSVAGQSHANWNFGTSGGGAGADGLEALATGILGEKCLILKAEGRSTAEVFNETAARIPHDIVVLMDAHTRLLPHALATVAKVAVGQSEAAGQSEGQSEAAANGLKNTNISRMTEAPAERRAASNPFVAPLLYYCDTCILDERDRILDIFFKPDWNEELALSQNYLGRPLFFTRAAFERLGGFSAERPEAEGYDLALRLAAAEPEGTIVHLAEVLASRRQPEAADFHSETARQSARAAVADYLAAKCRRAEIVEGPGGFRRLHPALPDPAPKVSIIVPTRDRLDLLRPCVESVLALTDYPDFELIIVDNDSAEPETADYLAGLAADGRARILPFPGGFNYSAINNFAARAAAGSVLVLLNNDTEVVDAGWLRELVGYAAMAHIGAAGAKLLYPDGTIQHAGMIRDPESVAWHSHQAWDDGFEGYFWRPHLAQHTSAVTGACLAIRRDLFLAIGGLNEERLRVEYNDVDLCFRLHKAGYRNVYVPYAVLIHKETQSRGHSLLPENRPRKERERSYMAEAWAEALLDADPWYSTHLCPKDALAFEIEASETGDGTATLRGPAFSARPAVR